MTRYTLLILALFPLPLLLKAQKAARQPTANRSKAVGAAANHKPRPGSRVSSFAVDLIKGPFGLKNSLGDTIAAPRYSAAAGSKEGVGAVRDGAFWIIMDSTGKEISRLECSNLFDFSEGLSVARKGDKYGFIDRNSNWVLPAEYDQAFSFEGGVTRVKQGGKYKLINKEGKSLACCYEYITEFNCGRALIFAPYNSRNYISRSGELLYKEHDYSKAQPFSNGLAAVENYLRTNDRRKYVIDTNNRILFQHNYDQLGDYSDGLFPAKNNNGKWGYIDTTQKEVIPCKFYGAGSFVNGYAAVEERNDALGYGLIDRSGNFVVPPVYHKIWNSSSRYASLVKEGAFTGSSKDSTYFFDKRSGKMVADSVYTEKAAQKGVVVTSGTTAKLQLKDFREVVCRSTRDVTNTSGANASFTKMEHNVVFTFSQYKVTMRTDDGNTVRNTAEYTVAESEEVQASNITFYIYRCTNGYSYTWYKSGVNGVNTFVRIRSPYNDKMTEYSSDAKGF